MRYLKTANSRSVTQNIHQQEIRFAFNLAVGFVIELKYASNNIDGISKNYHGYM
jgi:hypothetical protein